MSSSSHLFSGLIIPEGTMKESSTMEEFLFWQIYPSFWLHATFSHLPFLPWKIPHIFISSTEGFPLGKKHNIQRITLLTLNIFISPQEGMHSHMALVPDSSEWEFPGAVMKRHQWAHWEDPHFKYEDFPPPMHNSRRKWGCLKYCSTQKTLHKNSAKAQLPVGWYYCKTLNIFCCQKMDVKFVLNST